MMRGFLAVSALTIFLASAARLSAQEAGDLRVELNKPFYTEQENIQLRIYNDTGADIPERDSGSYFYFSDGNAGEFEVPQKQGDFVEWNSRDYQRHVTPGTHTFQFWRNLRGPDGRRIDARWYEIRFEVVPTIPRGRHVFRTTKAAYAKGEEVSFYLLSRHRWTRIILSNGAPWQIQTRDGMPVFSPIATMALVSIPPNGGRRIWSWNQRDEGGSLVAAGRYRVELGLLSGTQPLAKRASFRILP